MHRSTRPAAGRAPPRRLTLPALLALGAGLAYYAALRGDAPAWPDPSAGTFPSLVHGFATTLLLLAATGTSPARRAALAVGANVALTAAFELTLGTFDPNDLVALGAGTLAAALWARAAPSPGRRLARRAAALALAASATMTVATAPEDPYPYTGSESREPVYLSYAALREAVRTTAPRALEDVGRVYLYEDFLFLNARNEGVHVVDNADPANPRPVSFIEIPGNTELAIRDGVLYADSYVDLVAIELGSFGAGPVEVSRQTDIFPWDPYQNVPAGTRLFPEPDPALGVVVGVEGDGE